jgi:uncharacterized protein (TIGR03435 family)
MERLSIALGVLLEAALIASPAFSQIPAESPGQSKPNVSFEVVSVKADPARSRTEAGPPTLAMHPSGRFTALNVTVRQLILSAYDMRPFQIVGGPDWMGSQLFDILAQAPDDFEMGQTRAMMRRFLEERFGLVVQRATSVMQVYSLERVGGNRTPGIWLRRPPAACDRAPADPPETLVGPLSGRRSASPRSPGDSTPDRECGAFWGFSNPGTAMWFYSRRHPLSSILLPLGSYAGAPVIDNTGLTGEWDLDIKWDLDASAVRGDAESRYGSFFTAVREQLGLKLEPTKSTVNVLVIEQLERPSPN